MLEDLVVKNRSTRRYKEEKIDRKTLLELVDLARLSACGRNRQPLKYILSNDPDRNAIIFAQTNLAETYKPGESDWQCPSAYIVILGDTRIAPSFGADPGVAAQSMLLRATEMGLNGLMIGTLKREVLREKLKVAAHFEILLVVAFGKQGEKIVLEVMPPGGDYKGWRDAEGVYHLPKRTLEEIIVD